MFFFYLYLMMSLSSMLLYFVDKEFAKSNHRRIPEKYLHLSDLLGGWPGGYFAMQLFKHKRQKAEFLKVYYAIIAIHIVLWTLPLAFF